MVRDILRPPQIPARPGWKSVGPRLFPLVAFPGAVTTYSVNLGSIVTTMPPLTVRWAGNPGQ